MASVTAFIRTSAKKTDKVKVRFRLSDGRKIQLFHKSEIEVDPDSFDEKKQEIKAKIILSKKEKTTFNNAIADRKKLIRSIYDSSIELTSEILELKIDQSLHPEKYISDEIEQKKQSYFEIFDEFLKLHKISEGRKAHYRVLKRALQRYELYREITLDIDTISKDTIRDIETFLKDEKSVFDMHPEIYEKIPESRKPQPRGINTISGILSRYRTFCLWMVEEEKTTNNPFKGFSIDGEVYGTPYYISIEERNKLHNFDLSERPQLAIQRDIFIFHCLIGCRIGDLYSLTKSSVINGGIEYIARKTKEGKPVTVRVPMNKTAKEILSHYPVENNDRLFPFIAEQNYNLAIKEMFAIAGLTRIVTVINPATREEEKRPLNEIASSHLARRCFIGNLYKKVKDPNLVGNLSGHIEGSKAFARYREIDEEIKQDTVNLLD
jgi:site-specific recombinase XerD